MASLTCTSEFLLTLKSKLSHFYQQSQMRNACLGIRDNLNPTHTRITFTPNTQSKREQEVLELDKAQVIKGLTLSAWMCCCFPRHAQFQWLYCTISMALPVPSPSRAVQPQAGDWWEQGNKLNWYIVTGTPITQTAAAAGWPPSTQSESHWMSHRAWENWKQSAVSS